MNDDSGISPNFEDSDLQAPPKLVAAFQELSKPTVFVPPTVDQSVLQAARCHLAPPRSSAFSRLRSWITWPAYAAACFAIIGLIYFLARPAGNFESEAGQQFSRSGHVDILDAFRLARQLQAGQKPTAGLDLNRDGVVDWHDVKILAARAVQLEKGSRS